MGLNFQSVGWLLLVAALIAILTRRLRLPYSAGLVLAGFGLALLPFAPHAELTKGLLFNILLPPLIFEAALAIEWKPLRRDLTVVLLLAGPGVVISAAVCAGGMHYLAGWPWFDSAIFGVLIAATDPVSVIAGFKEAKVRGRLLLLVESESLFNDGTAAVLFAIVLEMALGAAAHPAGIVLRLAVNFGGSMLCGGAIAGLALLLAGRSHDHLVEITFTTLAAFGSFSIAEHFGFSGVLATMTAGLIIGNAGSRDREAVDAFWEYAAFVSNSLVFILIGMRESNQNFLPVFWTVGCAIAVVTAGRALTVYGCCAVFSRGELKVAARHRHILFWGGLRGALALALALALPPEILYREAIVTVTFAVVAWSIFVQGLTLPPLLRWFGEIPAR